MLTVSFHGLCALVEIDANRGGCFLHPEGGAHKPVLVLRVSQINTALTGTSWTPDFVGHDEKGEEIGIWSLKGQHLQMGKPTAFSLDRNNSVNLRDRHNGKAVNKSPKELMTVAEGSLVELFGGSVKFAKGKSHKLILKKNGAEIDRQDTSMDAEWTGEATDITNVSKGLKIEFKDKAKPLAAAVSNISPVPFADGFKHFKNYYDFIESLGSGDYPIELADAESDADVYDCVPPTPLA